MIYLDPDILGDHTLAKVIHFVETEFSHVLDQAFL
jgi:hypothetical protein